MVSKAFERSISTAPAYPFLPNISLHFCIKKDRSACFVLRPCLNAHNYGDKKLLIYSLTCLCNILSKTFETTSNTLIGL